jgi:ectoine hydroxylase-related dioxygenase (phytanoyl-CoA dioxygenase family)
LSYHNQANPYLRYDAHPEEVMITCGAGSAAVFDHCLFHGNYANTGDYAREALQLAYRPTWAGPSEAVEPWDAEEVAKLPTAVQELMGDRGERIWIPEAGNKPPDMPTAAPGLNPSRWDLE